MKIAVHPNLTRKNSIMATSEVCNKLEELQVEIIMPIEVAINFDNGNIKFTTIEESVKQSDIVISIGGDGTLINSAYLCAKYDKPILGVNAGNLGFLTSIEIAEIELLEKLVNKKYKIDKRMMICAEHYSNNSLKHKYFCVNDLVVSRGVSIRMCDFTISLNGSQMNEFAADGVIFATPTGSTAYTLSAGGAIVEPTVEGIIFTPICAHTLHIKPMVFDANSVVKLEAKSKANDLPLLSFDGHKAISLALDDEIFIHKANISVKIIRLKTDNFIETIFNKFIGQA